VKEESQQKFKHLSSFKMQLIIEKLDKSDFKDQNLNIKGLSEHIAMHQSQLFQELPAKDFNML